MATRSGQELDLTRLVAIVLLLIVGGIFARTFFRNYVSEPARVADTTVQYLEVSRASGRSPMPPPVPPGAPGYDLWYLNNEYIRTGDEQAKQQVIRIAKRNSRAKHSLAIWGSFAMACVSIIVVVSAGLPMLRQRRA